MKRFVILLFPLALLSLVSHATYSDVVLTEEEYNQVMTALDESEMQITELQQESIQLQQELSEAKQALIMSRNELNIVKQDLAISSRALDLQKTLFGPLETSFEARLKNEYWRGFKDGFFFGFLTGGSGGFVLGIKIRF